jgi:hypothetical protein
MKKLLAAMFVALLMVGCGENVVDLDDPETLDEIIAEAIVFDQVTNDYTGWAKKIYYFGSANDPNTGLPQRGGGQISDLVQFKDGNVNGVEVREINYKNGNVDGLWTTWYENGQKRSEHNYKDGKKWTAVHWKPNGEKCPKTNIVEGNGGLAWYDKEGVEYLYLTYKDGEADYDNVDPNQTAVTQMQTKLFEIMPELEHALYDGGDTNQTEANASD